MQQLLCYGVFMLMHKKSKSPAGILPTCKNSDIQGPSEKFVKSPYYSESELCGGAVMVSFFKVPPLASDALLTLLHPLLKNVLQTTDHFKTAYLGAPFSW
jgi:hypothetical protein